MTIRTAIKGDPLVKHLTADFLNKLKREPQSPSLPSVPVAERYDYVLGQIDPANTGYKRINTYWPAITEDVFVPQNPDHFRHLASKTIKVHGLDSVAPMVGGALVGDAFVGGSLTPELLRYNPWGIALDPINQSKSGRVLMLGMCWLDITTLTEDETEHTYIDIIDNKLILLNSGPCRIISYKKPHALVCMQQSSPGKVVCFTTATIAPATLISGELTPTYGTVKLYNWNADRTKLVDTTKTLPVGNMSLGTVSNNTFVQAFFHAGKWLLDYENCTV